MVMGDGGVAMGVEVEGVQEGSGGGGGADSPNAKVTAVVASGNYRVWLVKTFCVG